MTRAPKTEVRKIAERIVAANLKRGYVYAIHAIPATYCDIASGEIIALAASVLRKSRGIERREGITADESKRAKALIAAYAKKPKKNGRVKVSPWKYRRRGVVRK